LTACFILPQLFTEDRQASAWDDFRFIRYCSFTLESLYWLLLGAKVALGCNLVEKLGLQNMFKSTTEKLEWHKLMTSMMKNGVQSESVSPLITDKLNAGSNHSSTAKKSSASSASVSATRVNKFSVFQDDKEDEAEDEEKHDEDEEDDTTSKRN
jgi:hypothetical protein